MVAGYDGGSAQLYTTLHYTYTMTAKKHKYNKIHIHYIHKHNITGVRAACGNGPAKKTEVK